MKRTTAVLIVLVQCFLWSTISTGLAIGAPVYAVSINKIDSFNVTGATIIGISEPHFPNLSINTAKFGGYPQGFDSDNKDGKQAKSGPGPFPVENTFTPNGTTGEYARSDSIITSYVDKDTRVQV